MFNDKVTNYYNPSFDDYIGRKRPQEDEPSGCWWRLLVFIVICLALTFCVR